MGATTPNLNLYKPGGGSTGLILPDERVDVDKINGNMDLIDVFAGTQASFRAAQLTHNQQYRGLAADIGTVTGMVLGDTYQETDGNKGRWRYNGTSWISGDAGTYLIRPSSVTGTGATIAADGSVVFANTPSTGAVIEGIFSPNFRAYKIILQTNFGASGAPQLQLTLSGTAAAAANSYQNSYLYNSGASPAYTQNNLTFFALSAGGSSRVFSQVTLDSPGTAEWTSMLADTNIVTGTGNAITRMSATHVVNTAYTGIAITTSSSQAITTGYLKVYGMA